MVASPCQPYLGTQVLWISLKGKPSFVLHCKEIQKTVGVAESFEGIFLQLFGSSSTDKIDTLACTSSV
jgi:hypothetical protein